MPRKKHWSYTDTSRDHCGTMICTACGQAVTEGQFRRRDTEEAYLVQHRRCSEQDENWAQLDAQATQVVQALTVRVAAYKAFREQWQASELDDAIEDMQLYIEQAQNPGRTRSDTSQQAPSSNAAM